MKLSLYILFFIMTFMWCCKKPKSDDPTPINPLSLTAAKSPYATLTDYFKKTVNTQLFSLPNNEDSVRFVCNQGTVITLYRSSILDVNNVPIIPTIDVRIEIQEYLDAKDIILYGKNTNATDTLLASQGLINIRIKDGTGNLLQFASVPNALKIKFPAKTYTIPNSDFYLASIDANGILNSTLQPNGRNTFTKQIDAIEGGEFYTYSLPQATNWIHCGYPRPLTNVATTAVTISFDDAKLIGKQKLVYAYSEALNAAYVSVTSDDVVKLNRLPQGYNFKLVCLSIVNDYMYADVQNWNNTSAQLLRPKKITDDNYNILIRNL